MSDPVAGLPAEGASNSPALTQADIDKIKAEMSASFDDRIKGLQRVIGGKDDLVEALRTELEQFKTAGMSEEEREQLELEKYRAENQRLQAQLELRDLAKDYAEEAPFFERLLAADSAEAQLKVMREFATTLKPAQVTEEPKPAPADPDIPDVDLNRPLRQVESGQLLPDGTRMDEALADRILGGIPVAQATITQRRLRPSL